MNLTLIGVLVAGYLIGAIPFGVIVCRAQGIDIFKVGSGSTGATNVSRALGKKWGGIVFLLDVLKGVVPTVVARFLVHEPIGGLNLQAVWFLCGLSAVVGHCLSPFIGFRGGKGIATALGVGLAAAPVVALSALGIFIVVFSVSRFVSLASICAVASATIFAWVLPGQARELAPIYGLVTLFVIYRHRSNISRLLAGTEPKFKFKKKDEEIPSLESVPVKPMPSEAPSGTPD